MSKNSNQKMQKLFVDPDTPMTYAWLEHVMANKKEAGSNSKQNKNKNNKKSKRYER